MHDTPTIKESTILKFYRKKQGGNRFYFSKEIKQEKTGFSD